MSIKNTPYDDVFRTLLNDCSSLILPVINEMFGEHFTGEETIVFYPNEHFMNRQDGDEDKRVTDTNFMVISGELTKRYHFEIQSTTDEHMLFRLFEYDSQIALDQGEIIENVLTVTFPHSGLLYLRHDEHTPDRMTIRLVTPEGETSYTVPVLKTQKYTLEEIFERDLLFLIPFYILLQFSTLQMRRIVTPHRRAYAMESADAACIRHLPARSRAA